ncbi:hypothetical protein [Nocardioides sp. GXZ039]|uniref:hypothetical protein n=1 Tax=Nocardioides sp. GXZ039 TaxID=3136018 RepID=UPI0030F3F483
MRALIATQVAAAVTVAVIVTLLSGAPTMARPDPAPIGHAQRAPSAISEQEGDDSIVQLRRQIEENSLTPAQAQALQARVSRVIARTGGTQVAINQVVWNGGDTLIPLPGEQRARELGRQARAGTVHGCHYYQFCTYGHRDYSGMVDRISSCTWHISHGFFVAYVNNQTPGTRARFYDYYRHYLATSQPAFSQDARFGNTLGHQTHYIKPC